MNNSKSWKTRFWNWLGLTNQVTIKVYHGYGYKEKVIVHGHVLLFGPLPRKKYRKSVIRNTFALFRLFLVKPYKKIIVQLEYDGKTYQAETADDGFYKCEWDNLENNKKGWQEITATIRKDEQLIAQTKGQIYFPYSTQYGFISDIDDTFLISYSSNLRKRLFVLFTQNARSRKPFEGVVKHYQLLSLGNTTAENPNPFFYVSSSEWNLYDYLVEFTKVNLLPGGVYLLNQLKRFSQLLKTGQNNHSTKFIRITRILEHFPQQKFVLLGDSSQQDPFIYLSIVTHFPAQIYAVYIRDILPANKQEVLAVLQQIESMGIKCCLFNNSSEAIIHSHQIGLINSL
jgi:phosphatidate phosphatase APP1